MVGSHNAYTTRNTNSMHNTQNKKEDLIITRITLTPKIKVDKGLDVIKRITSITRLSPISLRRMILSEKGEVLMTHVACKSYNTHITHNSQNKYDRRNLCGTNNAHNMRNTLITQT